VNFELLKVDAHLTEEVVTSHQVSVIDFEFDERTFSSQRTAPTTKQRNLTDIGLKIHPTLRCRPLGKPLKICRIRGGRIVFVLLPHGESLYTYVRPYCIQNVQV